MQSCAHDKQTGLKSGQKPMSFSWLSNNINKGNDFKHPKQCYN